MPGVPKLVYKSHLLVDGVDKEAEVWPGWTEMTLQLLENDIEVIDTVSERWLRPW